MRIVREIVCPVGLEPGLFREVWIPQASLRQVSGGVGNALRRPELANDQDTFDALQIAHTAIRDTLEQQERSGGLVLRGDAKLVRSIGETASAIVRATNPNGVNTELMTRAQWVLYAGELQYPDAVYTNVSLGYYDPTDPLPQIVPAGAWIHDGKTSRVTRRF